MFSTDVTVGCTSKPFAGIHRLASNEGNIVDDFTGLPYGSEDKCMKYCFANEDCKSFTYCRNGDRYNCHLKDRDLVNIDDGDFRSKHNYYCTSYTKNCEGNIKNQFNGGFDNHLNL